MIQPDDKADLLRGVDHIGVSASFILHDGHGNVLLQKRGLRCRDEQGRWDNGGGAIEFGETIEDAMKREVYEELCVESLDMEFLTVYDAHRENNGVKTHWVAVVYAIKINPAKVKIGEPHKIDETGWFTSKSLPEPLHSQFHKSYDVALANGIVK